MGRLVTMAALLLTACGEDPLDEDRDIRYWVNAGSAVAMYTHVHEPVAFADGESMFRDPACPVTTDDGSNVTITGGCTDSEGVEWVGSATIVRGGDGSRALTFDGYARVHDPSLRALVSGTGAVTPTGAGTHAFSIDVVQRGGLTTRYAYDGTIAGGYDGPTTWNGEGTVDRDGIAEPTGRARVETIDEVVDDTVCSGAPVSGQTIVRIDDHRAVLTYDGATECDADKSARWSLDGDDQGLVTGITCAATSASPGALAPIGIAALWLAGRTRRRGR